MTTPYGGNSGGTHVEKVPSYVHAWCYCKWFGPTHNVKPQDYTNAAMSRAVAAARKLANADLKIHRNERHGGEA